MTEQIKQNQVVPTQPVKRHPVQGPPRDVQLITLEDPRPAVGQTNTPVINNSNRSVVVSPPPQAAPGTATAVSTVQQTNLQTPLITSIKSQTVTYQGDGTAAIDVIVIVSDITGAKEYDLRITKNAGPI